MSKPIYFNTTTSQNLLLTANKVILKGSWFNIAALIEYHQEIDPELMLKAIDLTMRRNEFTRLRLHKTFTGKVVQYISECEPEGLEILDLSSLSDDELHSLAEKWAQTSFPRRGIETQLYKIKLINRGNNRYCAYMNFHHMGFDSYAIMMVVKYIDDTYTALVNGTPIPPETGSPMPMYESEFAYEKSINKENDRKFWKDFFPKDDEPQFTSLYGKNGKFNNKGKRTGCAFLVFKNKSAHLNLRIPKSTVDKINLAADNMHLSPQNLYLLGLHTYLGIINDSEDVLSVVLVARRAKLVHKNGGGTMVNSVMTRTKIPYGEISFADGCNIVNRELCKNFRHASMTTFDVNKYCNAAYGTSGTAAYNGVIFCYQPYFKPVNEGVNFSFERLNNGSSPQPLMMTILACDKSGDLYVNYEMMAHYYTTDMVEKFHEFYVKFLDEAAENPEKLISDIAEKYI